MIIHVCFVVNYNGVNTTSRKAEGIIAGESGEKNLAAGTIYQFS